MNYSEISDSPFRRWLDEYSKTDTSQYNMVPYGVPQLKPARSLRSSLPPSIVGPAMPTRASGSSGPQMPQATSLPVGPGPMTNAIQSQVGFSPNQQIYDPRSMQVMQNQLMAQAFQNNNPYTLQHQLLQPGRSMDAGQAARIAMQSARGSADAQAGALQQLLGMQNANQGYGDTMNMLGQDFGRNMADQMYGVNAAQQDYALGGQRQGLGFLESLLSQLGMGGMFGGM